MAATNFTPISLYHTTTAAATPSSGNLVNGELAINITDEKLYFKNTAGTVKLLASSTGADGDVVGPASSTDNSFARFDSTTGKLLQNSPGATMSDTGAPSFTGNVTVAGTSAAGGGLVLAEDTDNGTNTVTLRAPASIASNFELRLPTADGSSGQAIVTDGSGNLSFGAAGISTGKSIAMAMIFGF
jgi:hypothetical protein